MSHWSQELKRYGACDEAVTWASVQPSRQLAWERCERPDWMFFVLGKLGTDRKRMVLAACACARLALRYVEAGEDRPRVCIERTEAWTRGEATIEQVCTARDAAADAAAAAYSAAAYAAYAAEAAAYAAYAAEAAYAADAAYAAYAAEAAWREMRLACCNEIRRIVPVPPDRRVCR